jgi:hypothetical protein
MKSSSSVTAAPVGLFPHPESAWAVYRGGVADAALEAA